MSVPPGKWVRTRTEADARQLLQEHEMFGKRRPARSRQRNLVFGSVIVVLLVAAVVSGFVA